MNIIQTIPQPLNHPSLSNNLPSQLAILRSQIVATDVNSISYILILEEYLGELCLWVLKNHQNGNVENLLKLSSNVVLVDFSKVKGIKLLSLRFHLKENIIPWKGCTLSNNNHSNINNEIYNNNNNNNTNFTLSHELIFLMISLSLSYQNQGIKQLYNKFYILEENFNDDSTNKDKATKWSNIISNYFKRAVSVAKYLLNQIENTVITEESSFSLCITECTYEFISILYSYLETNLQLTGIIIRNFWTERYKHNLLDPLDYLLSNLNSEWYKSNNHHLLLMITTHCYNQLRIIKNLLGSSIVENEKIIDVMLRYLTLYLAKYLTLQLYIVDHKIGTAIGVLNYAFSVLDNNSKGFNFRSTNFVHKTSKLKANFGGKSTNRTTFDAIIQSSKYYREVLLEISHNELILQDMSKLVIQMHNLRRLLIQENDNITFETVDKIEPKIFEEMCGLGRSMPVTLEKWTPEKILANANHEKIKSSVYY